MGKLIVIEGLDGSGKSTQTGLLGERFEKEKRKFRRIKLPDYDSQACAPVKMYLSGAFGSNPGDVNAYAASAFYAVDRFASFKQSWQKDYLDKDTLIISDRYATSNAVHQMVKLPESEWDEYLAWLEDFEYKRLLIPKPNLVIFLDMPVEVSQRLMSERYNGDEIKKDVHEKNVEYLESCRKTASYASERLGWKRVLCARNGEALGKSDINDEIYSLISKEFF